MTDVCLWLGPSWCNLWFSLALSVCALITIFFFHHRSLVNLIGCSSGMNPGICLNVRNGAKIRNRYNQVPYLTQDITWERKKNTINITNKSQEVSPFPEGDSKAAMNRRESMTNTRHENTNDPQKKYRFGTVSKNILLKGLNHFHGANLTLDSYVDQDTFGKVTKHNTHNSQEVRPFPAGDHKATKNRHDITTHSNMKHN